MNLIEILVSNGIDRGHAPYVLRQIFQPLVEKLEGIGEPDLLNRSLRLSHYSRPYHSYTKVRVWNEGFEDCVGSVLKEIHTLAQVEEVKS